MSSSVLILGGGGVGRAIGLDFVLQGLSVTIADKDEKRLMLLKEEMPSLKTLYMDLRKEESLDEKSIWPYDLVINALPGAIGYKVLTKLISCGKNVVDVSFFPEDPFLLNELAMQKGVTAIVDAGIAPGLCNLLLGYHIGQMNVESYECLVGGLPVERSWPYQYKAPFSLTDVIEEYTRPVKQRLNGKEIIKPPLSDVELVEIHGVGTLEAFNTDGLRTLLRTTQVPNLKEKTLRYPGHAECIRILQATGLFSAEAILINGHPVRPIEVAYELLRRVWALSPNDKDLLIMRVRIEGWKEGKYIQYEYQLHDEADLAHSISAMARTTGYTCAALASLLLSRSDFPKGVIAPEQLGGKEGVLSYVLSYLSNRDINLQGGKPREGLGNNPQGNA
ncbi:MAG: saccharopine dehydrogenase NADP-binding domain-containing protein [Bacteroidia bacterium]|nr:saccharopine dehydrogenase NADP-binding domain-containing protein [Bacteroidia bacterium]